MKEVFDQQKQQSLQKIDQSKKGSFDLPIHDLIIFINSHNNYFTTSSCSGRILLFSEGEQKKKGCKWLLTSHEKIQPADVIQSIDEVEEKEDIVFKYESFILHVQCRTLEDAQNMLKVALDCGYRNSGMVLGKKKKIMLAVRSTHALEVPIVFTDEIRVSNQYIEQLVKLANEKLEENFRKIDKFYGSLKESLT